MDDRKYPRISPSDLTPQNLVVTVNERLSRWLLLQHNGRMKKAGEKIWETPPISSLDAWVRESWKRSWSNKHVLNATQSQNLWENIIRKDYYTKNKDLLHLRGAAELAGQAYKLVKQYRLPESETVYKWTEESKAFHRWMKTYERNLQKLNSIDSSFLLDEFKIVQKQNSHLIPDQIILAGFDEIDPQLEDWLKFLETKNIQILFLSESFDQTSKKFEDISKNDNTQIRHFPDRLQEVTQCARWIRSIYSSDKTIGIIVPQLESYRPLINREFTSELSPESMFPWNESELPFNISKGTPLKNESAINLAIQVISAPSDFLPYKTFYSILTLPFLEGNKNEISGRMLLEKLLRRNNVVKVFLNQILEWEKKEKIPQLIIALQKLNEFLKNDSSLLPSVWAKRFSDLLKQMGWPFGDAVESNALYPLLEKWNECLDILASLDQITGKVSRFKAIDTLNTIIEIPYRKKSTEEPIQVVGLLESSGLEFDYLWVIGCDMKSLPAPPNPNPFIPMTIQKQNNLPHSTAERELNFAQHILSRLTTASPQIIFSYAKWDENSEQLLSTLLASTNELLLTPIIEVSNSPALQIKNSSELDIWEDKTEIPIFQEELLSIKGGHTILGNMAMCPFRAFAVHRLHTQKQDDPEIDIDAAKRGDLVHIAMELFWDEVKSHANLVNLDDEDKLVSQVRKNVNESIQKNIKHFFQQPNFTEMETDRIIWLILDWLQNDLSRPPFEVINTEESIDLKIDKLNLSLKIDRVDKTESGETVIIDYKTGKPNLTEWFQERLTQPQLPLYSLNKPASAIVFAVIKKNNCDFKGIAKTQDVIPDIHHDVYKKYTASTNWDDQMKLWGKNLIAISQNFTAGKLNVDPVDVKTTCKYCGLQSLCKIGEKVVFEVEAGSDG